MWVVAIQKGEGCRAVDGPEIPAFGWLRRLGGEEKGGRRRRWRRAEAGGRRREGGREEKGGARRCEEERGRREGDKVVTGERFRAVEGGRWRQREETETEA